MIYHGFVEDGDIDDPKEREESDEDQVFSPFELAAVTHPCWEEYGCDCRSED